MLLLVSGGASALLEVPTPGVGLTQLRALFDRSLREGLDIERLNRERIALSRVKGGRLAGFFPGSSIEALMMSDVPRDDPAVLASGLLDTPGLGRCLVGSIDDALDAVELLLVDVDVLVDAVADIGAQQQLPEAFGIMNIGASIDFTEFLAELTAPLL